MRQFIQDCFQEVIDITTDEKTLISEGLSLDSETFIHNTETEIVGKDFRVKVKNVDIPYKKKCEILDDVANGISHFMGEHEESYDLDMKIEIIFKHKK